MSPFSFSKADRILKRRDFLELSKRGRRIQNVHFIVYFSPGQYNRSRLGVTVTKKVGGAVTRNKLKRFVREFFRLNRYKLSGKWDINIIAKKEAAHISSEKAHHSLQNIFDRITNHDEDQ